MSQRKFTAQEREAAVARVAAGERPTAVARDLGVTVEALRRFLAFWTAHIEGPLHSVRIGRSELPAHETDLVTFAFGMAAGIAIGVLSVRVAGIPIGLSTAGGLLLVGLVIGWARTSNPTFGQVPAAAATVLMELGLQFFIANVGLEAGGSVVDALRTTGVSLPIAAFVVMATPVVTGVVVGRLLLGLDAVTLLGALTGALTSTPALDMINRKADSALPTVGYAGTYAFANVLLAVAGSILMRL